ncbi:hypothetical protein FANTH_5628 [Fusarium anthophilum]|uniref:Amino acid permease/ SLC12A domain-containing protein n=1 Tax=Fusarium anthophilum TaxID=48485 RepID=A0A8H5E6J6_9HYPO|nr:hypothetical protein FANTH_5628 [Fusarium anthophilum]
MAKEYLSDLVAEVQRRPSDPQVMEESKPSTEECLFPVETTHRGLKSRHAQMIALGGMMGTGFFVGSGAVLALGGPLFLLLGYTVMSIVVFGMVTAVVEIATFLPIPGSTMAYFGNRFVSSSFGFAVGWLYWYSMGMFVPYEITAAGLVIDYWGSPVNIVVWVTLFLVVIVAMNLMPVEVYGEAEFWFALSKVLLVLGLLVLSAVLFFGGGQEGLLAFKFWRNPGPIRASIQRGSPGYAIAFFRVLVQAAFPFVFAPELLVTTGGEMKNPVVQLPRAARRYIWRLVIFYLLGALAIGVICPSDNPDLSNGGAGAKSSPFVLGIQRAGIDSLGSLINAVVIISAASSGNSFLYLSSRCLYSMAIAGNAPTMFRRCNKRGVPYVAVLASSVLGVLAYLNCAKSGSVVFSWLVNITNEGGFIGWVCCSIIFFRFRKACQKQGVTNLDFKHWVQPYGAWIGGGISFVLIFINAFHVFLPGQFSVSSFLTAYIGLPAFLLTFFAHKALHWDEPWIRPAESIDMTTGRDIVEATIETDFEEGDSWYVKLRKYVIG